MLITHIRVRVKPEHLDAFIAATLANAEASLREPGVARFDILQDPKEPTTFLFSEAYRTPDAPAAHKRNRPLSTMARHRGRHDGRTRSPHSSSTICFPKDDAF